MVGDVGVWGEGLMFSSVFISPAKSFPGMRGCRVAHNTHTLESLNGLISFRIGR